jgi:regulator of sirC expression with transglutaminase-like and TPR domain
MRTSLLLIAFTLAAFAQRHKLDAVDGEKPEGKLLQQCMQESDAVKKAALMEQFVEQFPKLEQTAWVLEQLQSYYAKAGQAENTLAAGDKLLALDPGDPEAALQNLKAAEAQKNLALVRKYSDITFENAHKAAASSQAKEEIDYAKQMAQYADYALFRVAAEQTDPKVTVELGERLSARSPDSEYVAKMSNLLFLAYRQSGANDKALALAEKTLATDQSQPEMLLVVANSYLEQKKDAAKVHAYSARVVELMSAHNEAGAPMMTGVAHYISGKQYLHDNQFGPADHELRQALPLVESNAALKPEVLFLLGLANFKMEKVQDAANYFRSCSAIKSGFQAEAAKDLARIKRDYQGVK